MGNVFANKGDLDKALDFYNKSLQINLIKLGNEHTSVAAVIIFSIIYLSPKNYKIWKILKIHRLIGL